MSDKSEAHLLEDFDSLIKLYSDGSVMRGDDSLLFSLLPEPNNYKHVEYKDVVLDEEIGLWVRLCLPPKMTSEVPEIIYYHGGGFILFSTATPIIHRKFQISFSELQAGSRAPPSLCVSGSHIDFSRVVIASESAGGNIAHHVGMWARKAKAKMEISIKGLIFLYSFFGCEERTASENENSSEFSLEMSDTMWRLALPVGSNRDHPFTNPVIEEAAASALDLPAILFVIAGHDILRDQQLGYCGLLEKFRKQFFVHVSEEEDHGFLLVKMEEPSSVEALHVISDFMK